jgi:hypothetical protein
MPCPLYHGVGLEKRKSLQTPNAILVRLATEVIRSCAGSGWIQNFAVGGSAVVHTVVLLHNP